MEYFRKIKYDPTIPWLILGKGPSFKKIHTFKHDFNLFGLNHVAKLIKCEITHLIDVDVLDIDIFQNSDNILCPWHMHENSKVMWKTLPHLVKTDPQYATANKKLYWYNCSTWKKGSYLPNGIKKEIVKVSFFSAEAAFQILGMLGIKKVYSLGIDGGGAYARDFIKLGLMPFRNNRATFDDQFKMIQKTLNQFNMEWEPL